MVTLRCWKKRSVHYGFLSFEYAQNGKHDGPERAYENAGERSSGINIWSNPPNTGLT